MTNRLMSADLGQAHHKRLLGIIRDSLAFGGSVQLEQAFEALEVLNVRMDALKKAVKSACGGQLAATDLERMVNERLFEIAEAGFDYPASNLLGPAAQALGKLRFRLDQRKERIEKSARFTVTI